MLFKRHMTLTFIELKATGKAEFVPPVGLFIVLPAIFVMNYLSMRDVLALASVMEVIADILVPLLSVWWVLMVLREYIESDGNEILYVYAGKTQVGTVVTLLALYIVCAAVLMFGCALIYPLMALEFFEVALNCILYVGVSYFLVFLTRSVAITFIPPLLYTGMIFVDVSLIGFGPEITWTWILTSCVPRGLLGAVFFLLGWMLNRKHLRYN